jgi:hypothetical protein
MVPHERRWHAHSSYLLAGHEAEAAARFDEYLANRTGAITGAHPQVAPLHAARSSAT